MPSRALAVYAGRRAAERIREEGWHPDLFDVLLGASGGPKWFILSQLDQFLFGDYLQRRTKPLSALGSSIGSWRHACLAQEDSAAAVQRLEHSYLNQRYSAKPDIDEISTRSRETLHEMLGTNGVREILANDKIHSHIVTARGRGPAASQRKAVLGSAMALAAFTNAASRRLLPAWFQRVVFHSTDSAQPQLALHNFNTHYAALNEDSLAPALVASGAIPFVLEGWRDIPGAPQGYYWDGGIIDYHFDLRPYRNEGLILYPHFRGDLTPGWFDKFLPWRRHAPEDFDNLVLMCPSQEFLASLPFGKIPDRNDFVKLTHDERVAYWREAVARSAALREDFSALIEQADPLAGVRVC